MTGEAEAAGVSDALAVAHEHVGPRAKPRAGAEHDRRLAEAEQAGHVRERDPSLHPGLLDHLEPRQGDHDDRRHQSFAVRVIGCVRAGDEAHPLEAGARVDCGREAALEAERLLDRQIPAVRSRNAHGSQGRATVPAMREQHRFETPRVAFLLLALGLAPAVLAGEGTEERKRTIAVTGRGEVKATPDRALLAFTVETTAGRATEAAAENAKRSAAVVAALKSLLGSDGTVGTTRYTIEPRYESTRPGETHEPRITGYVARNEVQVECGRVDKLGGLIDAATAAGANGARGLQFSFSKEDELLRAALEKAGADARAQAEGAARGLGVRLKRVLSADTGARPVPVRFAAMEASAPGRGAATPIEPGEGTVSASLQVTYEIE